MEREGNLEGDPQKLSSLRELDSGDKVRLGLGDHGVRREPVGHIPEPELASVLVPRWPVGQPWQREAPCF